jgi:hypothetical protein
VNNSLLRTVLLTRYQSSKFSLHYEDFVTRKGAVKIPVT